ncbi:type VI secretion system-associated FHA domain protein TagH [Rhodobacter sp. SGA-6-6]|uniref:type VI secretion system-associated FHA domain protein TagH n=1 Tax=Rhodobacter sp. SGA-6-6 TaxID=2710882 RepID=UPI0013EB0662|nr:type VI secretion system-associated FHA domain protein TagH [Rhodobacter sp. SGA-6-6]NGM46383.1 type VI secretion system-associated FHA domain protein TagH [Rhodobacter sp. SGA-6-6]
MTLRLVLESFSHPQKRTEVRLADGQLVIGRSEDCGWQLEDPQMFVSRRHCVVMGQGGQYRVTDESSGGLFLDAAPAPLGQGVTAVLSPGMRLKLGDFVIRVEVEGAAAPVAAAPPPKDALFGDDFFTPRPEAPPPPRPASLPDPFDAPRAAEPAAEAAPRPAAPAFFDDPFTMEHGPRPVTPAPDPAPRAAPAGGFDFGDFGLPADLGAPTPPPPPAAPPAAPPQVTPLADPFADLPPPPPPPAAPPAAAAAVVAPPPPDPFVAPPPPLPGAANPDALAALLKGMGIAPPPGFRGTPEEIEAIGRRYRAMAEGLVQLLRMRAQEKGAARVAQTVIGAANVNPLKFLAGADEVVAALVAAKGPGYLDPDAAIAASVGDLMDHHKRSWSGLQAALRRMVDRFDPAVFEAEVEDVGMLKALVAGSRPARLWQLYADRYREIARAAEDRFLGEVGADFREAYESETRRTDNGTA